MSVVSLTWTILTLYLGCVIVTVSAYSITLTEGQPCRTPDDARGKCIRFKNCDSLLKLIQKVPLYNEDITFLKGSQCGYDNEPLVCCTDSLTRLPDSHVTEPNVTDEPTTPAEGFTVLSNLLPTPETCKVKTTDRIVGGKKAKETEYPWLVLLQYSKPNNAKGFHCGGVLINERYILTAAHCITATQIKKLKWELSSVRLGEYDLSTDEDCYRGKCIDAPVDIAVEKLIPHEQYAPTQRSQANDIALIRLSRPVKYTKYIKPICLPASDKLKSLDYDELALDVAGWGKTENASFSNVKLKLSVPGMANSQCNNIYEKTYKRTITSSQLCAGGILGEDSCQGDSGGPLMAIDRSNPFATYWYCAGIVSYGPDPCGKEGFPGVYTRVSAYTDWIVKNIKP